MTSERFFGQALLESDFVNPNFFYLMAKEDKKALRSCRVNIPPTALFEQGFAKALFTTETLKSSTGGEVKKKVGRDVDSDDVFESMTKGVADHSVCAVLIFASPRSTELTNVRFLDKEQVRNFVYHELEKPKCILQRFVVPKGNSNSLILATWSPLVVITEGRRSTYSLMDRHATPNQRGLTFEDVSVPTIEVAISDSVVKEVTKVCTVIAEHFDRVERLQLSRLTAFFKVDANNNLVLLYTTSLRFHDIVTGQEPVSLEGGVHFADLQRKSLTLRFQGLGQKMKRGSQDPLEWMDVALHAADNRNAHMKIAHPAVGNISSMIFNESRGFGAMSPKRAESRRSPSRGDSRQTAGGGGVGLSPTSAAGRDFPSPSGAARKGGSGASSSQHIPSNGALSPGNQGSAVQILSSALASSGGGGAEGGGGSTSFEGQYLTVAPGLPMPQPRQLLKFQHNLPNSVSNMNTQVQLHALGQHEEAIRAEWDAFLAQQLRDIRHVRIAQAGHHRVATAAAEGGEGEGQVEGLDDPTRAHAKQPPRAKHHATFVRDEASGALIAVEGKIVGEDRDISSLTANSASTLRVAQEKAAQREKDTFMEEMRNEVARRALQSTRPPNLDSGAPQDCGDDTREVELDDDPRFYYVPRDSRMMLSVPESSSVGRSTLLPPVFHGSGGGIGAASGAAGGTSSGAFGRSGRLGMSQSTSNRSGKAGSDAAANRRGSVTTGPSGQTASGVSSPQRTRGASKGAAATPAAKSLDSAKDLLASPATNAPSSFAHRARLVAASSDNTAATLNALPDVGKQPSPATPRSPAKSSAAGAAANSKAMGVISPNRRTTLGSGDFTTENPAQRYRQEEAKRAAERQRNFAEESHKRYARIAKPVVDDFSALDAQEIPLLRERASALCDAFTTYVQELHYSIHGAFLTKAFPVAYVELPAMFRGVVEVETLRRVLHKLHPAVHTRGEFMLYHPSSPAAQMSSSVPQDAREAEALKWRHDLIHALEQISLSDFPCESLEDWSALTRSDAVDAHCLAVPLLDGPMGLAILREESFAIAEDVKPYVSVHEGVIYHKALQHVYFARIAEIKGEQAAREERRQQLEAASEAERATIVAEQSKRQLSHDNEEDEQPAHVPLGAKLPLESSMSGTFRPPGTAGEGSVVLLSPGGKSRIGEVVKKGQQGSTGGRSNVHNAAESREDEALRKKVDDMMCPRCNTCRICCVCNLVSSPAKHPKLRDR